MLKMQSQNHQIWEELLTTHVSISGEVDYPAFVKQQEKLKAYLSSLSKNPPQNNWSEAKKKAYLINVYNAFTVQLIIENYPLESIKDIGGIWSSPFKKKFIKLGNETYSLDEIEKDMLLKIGDARVHFAINCASYSCPKLHHQAFTASNIEEKLEQLTSAFINDTKLNSIRKDQAELSKIFKWYKSDFEDEAGSLIEFINRYAEEKISSDAKISYKEYNWSLNEKR